MYIHIISSFFIWIHFFYERAQSALQLNPASGYLTALVFPLRRVILSSKSGQCSRFSHGYGTAGVP